MEEMSLVLPEAAGDSDTFSPSNEKQIKQIYTDEGEQLLRKSEESLDNMEDGFRLLPHWVQILLEVKLTGVSRLNKDSNGEISVESTRTRILDV